jgi:hypothetical protein
MLEQSSASDAHKIRITRKFDVEVLKDTGSICKMVILLGD